MVYYLKYRPQTLAELIGQETVKQILDKASQNGQLAHAYLFCGPKGTGKTSTARILTKIVNCEKQGLNKNLPCNSCPTCLSITDGSNLDFIEIDAASNRGIDDIRQLRENIKLASSQARKKVYVIDECFRYEDLVTLEDGTKVPIGRIVEEQLPLKVLSYNRDTSKIEPKSVVRYMKKKPVLPTVQITFNNNRSVVCTINHKFYTPEGQIRACNLKMGQFVYAHYERITQQQMEVITGAALGDGHIALTTSKMRGRLSISQGLAQKDYLEYKTQLLGDLVQTPPVYQLLFGSFSKKGIYRVATLSCPQMAELHRCLYDEMGRKGVTNSYLDRLTPLGLAIWYLDDGSLLKYSHKYKKQDGSISNYPVARSVFSTQGLNMESAEIIKKWFWDKWGIQAGVSYTSKGPVIWLTLAGTKQLHEIISPYVPPSMNYKLLPAYKNRFSLPTGNKILSSLAVSVVKDIREVDSPEFVYNLEVSENHNYFVRDILVSNCHMLTVEAFNGLLKTLEEPPSHVLFILATTEAQKIPETILSRVQRLDFQLATSEQLLTALQNVVDKEKLEIEMEALQLIAKRADGSFRDCLKLLDQLASRGEKITLAMAEDCFKSGKFDDVTSLIGLLNEKNSPEALKLVLKLSEDGINIKGFIEELLDTLRNVLLLHHGAQATVQDYLGSAKFQTVKRLAAAIPQGEEVLWIEVFQRALNQMKIVSIPSLPLEMAVVEICQTKSDQAKSQIVPALTPTLSDKTKEKLEKAKIEGEIPEVSTVSASQTTSTDLAKLLDKWNYILETVKPYNYSLEALLRQVKVISCEGGQVVLEVPYSFHQRILEAPKSRDLLESVISDVLNQESKVSCVLGARPVRVEEIANVEVAADDEIIRVAAEIFNSESIN